MKISIKIYRKILKKIENKGLHKYKFFRMFNRWIINIIQDDSTEIGNFQVYLGGKQARQYSVIDVEKEYNPLEMKIIKENVTSGDNVIDVGANIGIFTLSFSKSVSTYGKVFSFEPEPKNFEVLKKNISINNIENVILENLAVSNQKGVTKLFISENHGAHSIFNQTTHKTTGKTIDIKTIRLDDYFEKKSIGKISFVKIDVEGVEYEVLKGMNDILEKNESIKLLIEFIPEQLLDFGTEPRRLLEFLKEKKFSIYFFDYNDSHLKKLNDIKQMIRENGIGVNIFCKRE
ncbi:MAG: FkbM family methyltransferase [Candidatus Nitrosopelagicus sp.]|nr:FkbM family methyltransferase [Candidatus Nitrosopelagicus sp.]